MGEFLKMDLFFAVATAAVALVGILLSVAIWYVIRILRTVDRLSSALTDEAALVRADIRDLRSQIRAEGFKWAHLARFWRHALTGRSKRGRNTSAD